MNTTAADKDSAHDKPADEAIAACLSLDKPQSFFLYAGAGSGKTRSLVDAVDRLRKESAERLLLRGQRIGVITYTNAACKEIQRRTQFDPLVDVSTIHSFAWSLIKGYHADIRAWLRVNLALQIRELEQDQATGRPGTKAALDRERSIERKKERLVTIESARRFIYSPTGDNREREALTHGEVIEITADFIDGKPTLQAVLISRYPILLIDESQDTNRQLMDSLLVLQSKNATQFCLGLFGDTMQRIYADGKVDIVGALPDNWARPAKVMNHRCPGRVVRLINRIRAGVDQHFQVGRSDKPEGIVRLFLLPANGVDKSTVEMGVAQRMADATGDAKWTSEVGGYKSLILEHHMAARRAGFDALFEPLYRSDRLKTGLLDGSLPGIRLFANDILPLVQAMQREDQFAVAAIVRGRSPLLEPTALKAAAEGQIERLREVKRATELLMRLWDGGAEPSFLEVLRNVASSGLFTVPEELQVIAKRDSAHDLAEDDGESGDKVIAAWDEALKTPFRQIIGYDEYIRGLSRFGTHQGVKGLEFPRVMVIIDDEEARGFLFSYGKLFGAKAKTSTDLKNEKEGSETSIDRTRRLFYVTCSRAEESLAIVAYSQAPQAVRTHVLAEGWFDVGEVELLS